MGMTIDQLGELLESRGATDQEIEAFLEHFGVKGMHWGVRRKQTPSQIRENRAKGLGKNQLRSESKRVAAAGGGLRGTLKVRREMIKSGELSKEDARKGAAGFGRNVALALLAGGVIGAGIGGLTIKSIRG